MAKSQITWCGWANVDAKVGPTLALRQPNVDLLGSPTSPMSAQRRANIGAMLTQPLGDVGPTFFCQQFTNLLDNFLPTFGQPFSNLWLLIFPCNVPKIKLDFWCLKDVQKISYFKAYFDTCLDAWHFHDILQTSGQYVCYKSDYDFIARFLLLTYLYILAWVFSRGL